MRALFLDISKRSTGFAFDGEPSGPPRKGTWGVPSRCADFGEVGLAFQKWLRPMVSMTGAEIIGFEAPMVPAGGSFNIATNADTIQTLIGLCWAAQIVAAEKVIRIIGAKPQTIRKHFCGSGHAKKVDVMARCKLLRWPYEDDNQADAMAGWSWLKATHDRSYSAHAVTPMFARGGADART